MKKLLLFLLIIIPFVSVLSQDSTKVKSPQTLCKLKVGNTLEFNEKSIKFMKVTEDSRCPSDITCIWEGKVTLLIELYENNAFLEEKEIVFEANSNTKNSPLRKILSLESNIIYLYDVSPYPSSVETPILSSEYYLEFLVQ
ncbi:hypothetical protein ACSTS3_16430 [Aquimarina muelleri]|uniref:hypothetical protein n=1 Tax=Aquimarina muelleri TaxID=279356 RepID=UPI003F6851DF